MRSINENKEYGEVVRKWIFFTKNGNTEARGMGKFPDSKIRRTGKSFLIILKFALFLK